MQIKTKIVKRTHFDDLVLARGSQAKVNLGGIGWFVQGRKASNLLDLPKDLNGKISFLTCVLGIPIPAVECMRKD